MPAYTTVVTHATGDVFPATDWNTDLRDNLAFLHDRGADLASAATLAGVTNQAHRVTGVVTITVIPAPTGTGQGGNHLLLKFQSAGCAITASAAIVLTNGPFISVAGGVIEFWWDDLLAGWVEIGRANFDQPGREWDYKQVTGDVTGINATTEGTAQAVITGNSITYDGSRVKVEFYIPASINTAGSGAASLKAVVLRDTTVLADFDINTTLAAVVGQPHVIFDPPAAGAHTYAVKAFAPGGTTPTYTIKAGPGGSGAYPPAFLRVTRA